MEANSVETTHFDALGGQPTIDRLVDRFYDIMDSSPGAKTIRAMHGKNLGPMRLIFKRYLGEWLGGPKLYSAERGHPRLRMRHFPFPIGEAERDAWLDCMRGALVDTVEDASLRDGLFRAFANLADHMRNQPGGVA